MDIEHTSIPKYVEEEGGWMLQLGYWRNEGEMFGE